MIKSLITAIAIGTFAITSLSGPVLAQQQTQRCVKAPKDPIPCPSIAAQSLTPQTKYLAQQLPKQKPQNK